jgi:hypothetical protein
MENVKNPKDRSTDPAVQQVLAKSEGMDVTTVWDR